MATRNFSRNFSRRPSSLLRDYFDKICEILDISGETLESLTTSMYSKNIIGRRTKNKVLKDMGYAGANLLLNHLQLKLDKDPSKARRIFKMLRRQEPLHSIAKTMDKKLNRSMQQSPVSGLLQDEGMQDSFSSKHCLVRCKSPFYLYKKNAVTGYYKDMQKYRAESTKLLKQ